MGRFDKDPDPMLLVYRSEDANKIFLFLQVFLLFIYLRYPVPYRHIYSTGTFVFKDNKVLKIHKTIKSKVFLNFTCVLMEIREAKKFTDLNTDHC